MMLTTNIADMQLTIKQLYKLLYHLLVHTGTQPHTHTAYHVSTLVMYTQ